MNGPAGILQTPRQASHILSLSTPRDREKAFGILFLLNSEIDKGDETTSVVKST